MLSLRGTRFPSVFNERDFVSWEIRFTEIGYLFSFQHNIGIRMFGLIENSLF
jgi:hypothetical protein